MQHPPRQSPSIEVGLSISSLRRFRPAPPSNSLLPNVLIPGVSHAGAAMLAADLGRHPDVCLPDVKQINYFTPLRFGRPVESPLDDYDRHYSRWSGERYRVETGPDYFDGGLPMTTRIAESLPGVHVVLLLRDPAHRLWTSYVDKLARGRLPRAMSYETYIDRCLALRSNRAERFEGNRHFRTFSSGFYVEFLPDWLEAFGRRVLVVFTEDLQDEPGAGVRDVLTWLDLDPATSNPPAGEEGETGGYPPSESSSLSLNRRLWSLPQRTPAPWLEPAAGAIAAVRRIPRQSERTLARVRSLYAAANNELGHVLRGHGLQSLPGWVLQG
ncbi:MAG: hypothetical protein QG622_2184 [Actinomycetota bacterium]|nr:hypothetical protein [Actinomycetota bacterium]